MLAFAWYEPVYYKVDDSSFPSETFEKRGRFVGIAENVGHLMTFMILTNDTRKVISRSGVQTALDDTSRNKRLDPLSLDDVFTGPDPDNPVIYNRYNDKFVAEDGEDDSSSDIFDDVGDCPQKDTMRD